MGTERHTPGRAHCSSTHSDGYGLSPVGNAGRTGDGLFVRADAFDACPDRQSEQSWVLLRNRSVDTGISGGHPSRQESSYIDHNHNACYPARCQQWSIQPLHELDSVWKIWLYLVSAERTTIQWRVLREPPSMTNTSCLLPPCHIALRGGNL